MRGGPLGGATGSPIRPAPRRSHPPAPERKLKAPAGGRCFPVGVRAAPRAGSEPRGLAAAQRTRQKRT
ncbi:unnamed protein product [Caretta caretta]